MDGGATTIGITTLNNIWFIVTYNHAVTIVSTSAVV
jgi:hypothetical protein